MNTGFHSPVARFFISLAIAVVLLPAAVPSALAVNGVILDQQLDAEGKGHTVLRVWGSHHEMGYAHGWLLAEEIVESVNEVKDLAGGFYPSLRALMGSVVWEPGELEDELDGMVAALAELYPGEAIDAVDLKVMNTYGDWSYPAACRSHACWGSRVTAPVEMLATRRLDFTAPFDVMNHHVICAWDPDDGSPRWVNLAWPGFVVAATGVNEYGSQVSLHDYNTGGEMPDNPLPRVVAARYLLTLPDDGDISSHLADGYAALQPYEAGTGSFINHFTPQGHGGVITCSRADGFYDLRLPQPSYFDGEVLVTANAWTDGTYTPTGAEFMEHYYNQAGPKDLEGHWDLMGTGGLHLMSVAYRGLGEMTIWCQGRLDPGLTPRLEYEWSTLYGELPDVLLAAGPGPGYDNPPVVRLFAPVQDAQPLLEFDAYGAPHYGVNVTMGDPDGDLADELVTGAGPGEIYGPHVRGFELDGTAMPGLSFLAYGTSKYGVNVSCGDIDGDGFDELVTGAGPGAVFGPHVRAFDYDGTPGVSPVPGVSYFAYGTPKWGVNVTCGDIDGDGFDEIVTGAGPGAVYGPHVRGWNVDGGAAAAIPGVSFLAYGTNKFGVNVGCGDVDGDGMAEIITAPGPSSLFGAHVRGWNYDGAVLVPLANCSFFAWPPGDVLFGARVSARADLDGDGRSEILVGAGPSPDVLSPVACFSWDGSGVTAGFTFDAFPEDWAYGCSVVGGGVDSRGDPAGQLAKWFSRVSVVHPI